MWWWCSKNELCKNTICVVHRKLESMSRLKLFTISIRMLLSLPINQHYKLGDDKYNINMLMSHEIKTKIVWRKKCSVLHSIMCVIFESEREKPVVEYSQSKLNYDNLVWFFDWKVFIHNFSKLWPVLIIYILHQTKLCWCTFQETVFSVIKFHWLEYNCRSILGIHFHSTEFLLLSLIFGIIVDVLWLLLQVIIKCG